MLRAAVGSLARKVSRSHLSHSAACRISTTSSCQKDVDYMDFPGGKVPFTEDLAWLGPGFTPRPTIPCYRALDSQGAPLPGTSLPHDIDQALATRMYETMISLQAVDTIFYEAQRQVVNCSRAGVGRGGGGVVMLHGRTGDDTVRPGHSCLRFTRR